jgi:hypothetical protein
MFIYMYTLDSTHFFLVCIHNSFFIDYIIDRSFDDCVNRQSFDDCVRFFYANIALYSPLKIFIIIDKLFG